MHGMKIITDADVACRWKGTGEFINTFFMCRLCALLHDETHVQHYEDINRWWRGEGTCIAGSWRTADKMVRGMSCSH
jgi:glycoprotein 3-alpha-L-fucosyltransferase